MAKDSVGLRRLERKRNKPSKTARLILQLPELAQMISPMCKRFDMSIKHRARAAAAHRMPGAMHVEPLVGGFFAAADLVPHDWIKNLGATTGDRTKARFAKSFQCIANRHLENALGQMAGFDGGECLYMQLRIKRSEPSQEFEIPVLFQTGMQSADHVHFGDSKGKRIRHGLNNFVNCIFECVRVTLFGGKCAELAG